jgi:hypothetical protein
VGIPIVVSLCVATPSWLRDRRQPARSWEPPVCEDVSPGAEAHALLEDVAQQCNEDRDWERYSVCESDL